MIAGRYSIESDLLNEVALEGDVLAGDVREWHGNDIGQSLDFMDDSVNVGEVLPVLHPDLPTPYHAAQLLLDLDWMLKISRTSAIVP